MQNAFINSKCFSSPLWNLAYCYFRSGVTERWILKSDHHKSGVSSLHCHDLTGDGVPDLLVGRNDGSVEVYTMSNNENEESETEPTNCYSYVSFNKSVSNIWI